MVAKILGRALVCLLVVPQAVFALGLGDIRLNSSLNSPLDAEIELLGATPEELATLKPQLASRDTFARYGLEWPAFLSGVSLERSRSADGREVIKVRSAAAATEPFVTLLVEVNWARGRLVREYTVLLDPPVFAPNAPSQAAPAPVAAPAAGSGSRGGQIERAPARPAPAAAAPAPAPVAREPAPASAGGEYDVRRGDTLSGIAARLSEGSGTERMMVGIYQSNPQAFDGNMNSLRSGAVLRVPDAAALSSIGASDASSEIRRQYAAWRERTPASAPAQSASNERLRLVPPGQTGTGAPDAAAAATVRDLQGRVRQLETDLTESRRLLELRNQELSQLHGRLAAAQQPAAPQPAPSATPEPVPAPEPAVEEPPVASGEPAVEPTPAEPVAEEPAVAETPAAKPARPQAAPDSGASFTDTLRDYWYLPVLLLLGLLGLFGYRKWREKQAEEFDDSLSRLATASENFESRGGLTDTARLRKPSVQEEAFLVEESGTHERPHLVEAAPKPARVITTTEPTLSGETAINLDQGDPLAEADFHMAYGLYDQAADLIRIAISREPDRRDLKLKLLEVFFVWGNKDQFLSTARELAATRAEAPAGEWEKILIMGKQLAPDDELFSQSGSMGGAVAGGIDLDLEGGQNRIDFDLLGDLGGAEPPRQGVDLDFNTALGDKDPTGEANAVESEDLDFVLDDPGRGGDDQSGNTTREMTAKMPEEAPPFADPFAEANEAPTVEQPALRGNDNPTIRQKVDMALRQAPAVDQTAELAIDDLGLDLGALDHESGSGADAPTMVAGLDDRSRQIMEDAERRASATAETSMSGTDWMIDARTEDTGQNPMFGDLNATAAMKVLPEAPASDAGDTSRLAALDSDDLDVNFGDSAAEDSASEDLLDLDVGTPSSDIDSAFAATQKVGPEDLALPDLEPVTMSEVGTKLDLARAYMDMGDPDGARSILKEVLAEGSVSQKQEAQRLLEALPG